jgi:hypothetical protein
MFSPNQAIPIAAKVEINPKARFTLGVKAELEKIFSICPKLLLINARTLWPCISPEAGKKDTIKSNLGGQFATLGAKVSASINILTSMF